MVVRTRMAPSPTGEYHIGHLRTLLYNFALARQNSGQFIIRIEDTDQKRFVPGATEKILQVIKDYGLSWDEGPDIGGPYAPYIQTQRLPLYQKYIQELLDRSHAYYCFCSEERLTKMRATQTALHQIPKYDRLCLKLTPQEVKEKLAAGTPHVVRLRVPDNEVITFTDAVRGEIKINTNEIDDQVLIKSDGIPTYHFAAAVDDHLMNITHVLRGDEWITSTPKAILIYRYLGWEVPTYAHLTIFLDPSGQGKMSKRRGSVSARSFLEAGYLPEAMLNFLMLLGWNPGTEQEIFSLDDFIKQFSLTHLHKKQPVFDVTKLDYLNGVYIRRKTDEELAKLLAPFVPKISLDKLIKIVPLIKERLTKLSEATALLTFVTEEVRPSVEDLTNNGKIDKSIAINMLSQSTKVVNETDVTKTDELKNKLMELIKSQEWKTGDFFMVFRVAVTGSRITPPIVESLAFLEPATIIDRLQKAQDLL
ncbi:glutamate--tRNA ligase [Patescibacteria group bacterium]|nr:glutamate--tRNA ligase [Patescibacteria group bacterium]